MKIRSICYFPEGEILSITRDWKGHPENIVDTVAQDGRLRKMLLGEIQEFEYDLPQGHHVKYEVADASEENRTELTYADGTVKIIRTGPNAVTYIRPPEVS